MPAKLLAEGKLSLEVFGRIGLGRSNEILPVSQSELAGGARLSQSE